MADDSRDNDKSSGAAVTTSTGGDIPKTGSRLPKGVVLGKDGKPCRSCTSFADFKSVKSSIATMSTSHPHTSTGPPPDCPPDVEALGRSSWTLLHSITASYPVSPTSTDQSNVKQFLGLFGKLYPCWVCAEDFQDWMSENKIRAESRDEFGRWMCEAHNGVNRKLGKKEFDCNKWEERWRTGWKDGRCD